MANGHGGKRTPANPAPVSGPGALSQRTDGQSAQYVSGLPYGEGQQFMDLQSMATMAGGAAPTPSTPASVSAPAMAPSVGFADPTQRPNEPMTTGNPLGPGPGPEVMPRATDDNRQRLRAALPTLLRMADLPDTPPATRNAIRYLRGVL